MAKQIITTILDDLDGETADETVSFALDGVGFEIDLSSKHAAELRNFLGRFMDAGTRVGRVEGRHAQFSRHTSQVYKPTNPESREYNQKVRRWAAENGWELSDRGRIPLHIVEAFEQKQPNVQWQQEQERQASLKKALEEVSPPKQSHRRAAAAAFGG